MIRNTPTTDNTFNIDKNDLIKKFTVTPSFTSEQTDETLDDWTGDLINGATHYLCFADEKLTTTLEITLTDDAENTNWQFVDVKDINSLDSGFESHQADGKSDGKGSNEWYSYATSLTTNKKTMKVEITGLAKVTRENALKGIGKDISMIEQTLFSGRDQIPQKRMDALNKGLQLLNKEKDRINSCELNAMFYDYLTFNLKAIDSISGKTSTSDPSVGIGISKGSN